MVTAGWMVTLAAVDYPVRRERTTSHELRFDGAGTRTVDVRIIQGSIRVAPSRDGRVRLDVERHIRAETAADADLAEREVLPQILDGAATVGIVVRDDRGQACGEPHDRPSSRRERPTYQVTTDVAVAMPADAALRLCTINGEEIRVDGIGGDFDLSNVNGRIAMTGARGSGRAVTVNGEVRVEFAASPARETAFRTVNGEVRVTFPETLNGDLKLKTFNGGLFTDFDVTAVPVPATVTRETRGATRIYRSNDFTTIRVGRGGPLLTFETLNGDVRILRASR